LGVQARYANPKRKFPVMEELIVPKKSGSGSGTISEEAPRVGRGRLAPSPAGCRAESAQETRLPAHKHSNYGASALVCDDGSQTLFGNRLYPSKKVTPLQIWIGIITPASLRLRGRTTTRFLPYIDPREVAPLIHGWWIVPLLSRWMTCSACLPTRRIYFVELQTARRSEGSHSMSTARLKRDAFRNVPGHPRTHPVARMTGVALSVVLNEVGVQKGASWIVSEGLRFTAVLSTACD